MLAPGIFAAVAVENKIQQYDAIIGQTPPVFGCEPDQVLSKVQKDNKGKDNVAAIRIGGKTYVIVSSIIDKKLYDYLKKNKALLPNTRPISGMDLLYLYKDNDNRLIDGIDGVDLQAKVEHARNIPIEHWWSK